MWSPDIHEWRAAVFAAWCAGVIVHAGSAGAHQAAKQFPAPRPGPDITVCDSPLRTATGASAADRCRLNHGIRTASAQYVPAGAVDAANDAVHAVSPGAGQDAPTRRWGGMLLAQSIAVRTPKNGHADPDKLPPPHVPDTGHDAVFAAVSRGVFAQNPAPQPWHGLLLAQTMAGGTASDVRADSQEPAPSGAPDTAGNPATAMAGLASWRIPPVRWGGNLTTDIRAFKSEERPRQLQQIETANIKAASYIWQPWFARLSGGLGLVTSKVRSGGDAGTAADQSLKSSATAVTGNGDVTVFPVSRFPFNAYFDVSDSRASSEFINNNISSTRFGMRQTYRPSEGGANYSASFDRSTLESAAFGRDTVNALSASLNRNLGPQVFDLSGSHTTNTRSNTGESTAFSNLFARHSYRPDTLLSAESLASLSSSNFRLISDGAPSNNRSRFAQANTFATWRPDEDSPLFVSGGGRLFQSVIENNAGGAETLAMSGNLAATYALSSQTRVSGSASVTQLLTDATNALLTTQAANLSHAGNPIGISGFAYNWSAGANIVNQSGLAEGARQNVGGQLGHSIIRSMALGENSQVQFNFGQNLGATFDTVTARSQTLGHNASVSWRLTRDASTSAYVSVLGADTRTSGAVENYFQMVNLQVSGQVQFSRTSIAAANLTVQGVRQGTPSTPSAGVNVNSSGNLSYVTSRVFDVPRLRYTALYSINDSQFKTRLQGDVNAQRELITQSFEQRLDYALGRVSMRLTLRVAEIDGRRDGLIFFRFNREFGSF